MKNMNTQGTHTVPVTDPDEFDLLEGSAYDTGVEDLSTASVSKQQDPISGEVKDDDIPYVEPGPDVDVEPEDSTPEPAESEPEDFEDEGDKSTTVESDDEPANDDEDESELIAPFVDAFAEELGWDLGEDEKPRSISELVDYMQAVIEENSVPEFASEEMARLNEYVAAGGDPADYYSITNEIDYDNIDLDSVSNQRRVVERNLANLGYSDDRIRRTIARYEDAEVLRDEAEDALESLKEIEEYERQQLVYEKQQERAEVEAYQREFFNEVSDTIKDIEDVRGIPVNKADRAKLLDYIFAVGPDGQTQYQRDYNGDMVKNLVESAYFTMKGDGVVKSVKNKTQSEAVRALRDKLRSNTRPGRSTVSTNQGASLDALSSFARSLGAR
jgi:hypothetical protein